MPIVLLRSELILELFPAPPLFYCLTLALYGAASCVSFFAYAFDKHAAKRGRGTTRIAETHLHLMSLLGGWPGAWLAQTLFRHKTQKRSFQRAFLAMATINSVLLVGAIYLRNTT